MAFPDKSFYFVDGFKPGFFSGLTVWLDKDVSQKFYRSFPSEKEVDGIQARGRGIIEGIWENYNFIKSPYSFMKNDSGKTFLLSSCVAPGNACSLSVNLDHYFALKGGVLNSMLEYEPSNVDSQKQATTLLSLWLEWVRSSYGILRRD